MTVNADNFVAPDDPILVKKAKAVPDEDFFSKKIQEVIDKMFSIAYGEQEDRSKPVLVGLAAPQIGISKRVILVDVGADGRGEVSDLKVFINPEITFKSTKKEDWYEGCFSTDRVCGIVNRSKKIRVRYFDDNGHEHEVEYEGYVARIFQHEVDHLNGIEFVAHIDDDDKLHWVEDDEFSQYRDQEAWRDWPNKCPRKKWKAIKGIK